MNEIESEMVPSNTELESKCSLWHTSWHSKLQHIPGVVS